MPAIRQVKRSRRLLKQEPQEWGGAFDVELLYPSPEPDIVAVFHDDSSSDSPLPVVALEPPEYPRFIPRPSHARKRKEGHIPRPPNAFILFRSDFWAKERLTEKAERDHRQISRIAAAYWRNLTEDQRLPYRERAKAEKEHHASTWPHYKYTPSSRKANVHRKRSKCRAGSHNETKRCRPAVAPKDTEDCFENLVNKVEGDVDRELAPKATDGPSTPPDPRSSPPTASRSARVHTSSEVAPSKVKQEAAISPELVYNQPPCSPTLGFVRADDIPPLDLSAPQIDEEKPKFGRDFQLDIQAPTTSIDHINFGFGLKPHVYPFSSRIMLASYSDLDQDYNLVYPGLESPLSPPKLDLDAEFANFSSSSDSGLLCYESTGDISEEDDLLKLYTRSCDYDSGL